MDHKDADNCIGGERSRMMFGSATVNTSVGFQDLGLVVVASTYDG